MFVHGEVQIDLHAQQSLQISSTKGKKGKAFPLQAFLN
jgi:hypothetical protein